MHLDKPFVIKKLLKPKILIRSMSARRDAGYCIVLKALFEKYGFAQNSKTPFFKIFK